MARRFKENKYITNAILFLIVAGVIAELIPYILFILIIYITVKLFGRWFAG